MKEYFEHEIRLLNEAASEFAEQYPEQARMLNLQSLQDRDPYVERLLEGVAFLTAQIRKKIDDDIPEICQTFLSQMWPHMLRPFPSATIVQFQYRPGQLQQTYLIKENTQLQSQTIGDEKEKLACKFRSTCATKINPIKIISVETKLVKANRATIEIKIEIDSGANISKLDLSEINFYLHAEQTTATWLHYILLRQVNNIRIEFPEFSTLPAITLNENQGFAPGNLQAEECLTPKAARSFLGLHLLHEYFLFREKYLFVKLEGLESIKWPKQCQQFIIAIDINNPIPANIHLKKTNFLLHCVPAINLFSSTSEPIKLNNRKYEQQIIADNDYKNSIAIYDIEQVTTLNNTTGKKEIIPPLYNFHSQQQKHYYLSHNNKRPFLAFSNCDQSPNTTISCDITAYNCDYPRKYLHENQVTIPSADLPHFLYGANIIRPSALYFPPKKNDYRWLLLSHLSLNINALTNLDSLQQLLLLYDWSELEENKKRINGITGFEIKTDTFVYQGTVSQQLEFRLKINEEAFSSLADIHLFGTILNQFLTMYAPINYGVITTIKCYPSNKELKWQPKVGANYQAKSTTF